MGDAMEKRGIQIEELRRIQAKAKAYADAPRVWYDGQSGVRLPNNVFQARTLVDKKIVRTETTLTEEQWLLATPMDVAVGDRVNNGAITGVHETGEYVWTPVQSEKHRHEANYAFWDWDLPSSTTLTRADFASGKYTRDRVMTTKDVMEEVTKAATVGTKVSYVEMLACRGSTVVGDATKFVSHAWKYSFESLVESLAPCVKPDTFVWVDICTVNQHETVQRPFAWWQTTFKEAVGGIGHTLLVLAPWENPVPLTRSWCLWEIFSTVSMGARLEVVLSRSEEARFVEVLRYDFHSIAAHLCTLDTRCAEAGSPDDQKGIHAAVDAEDGGFQAVNQRCQLGIQEGLVDIATRRLGTMEDGEEKWTFMNQLGLLLQDQGKLTEAQALWERALKGYEETLGPMHPDTCLLYTSPSPRDS